MKNLLNETKIKRNEWMKQIVRLTDKQTDESKKKKPNK